MSTSKLVSLLILLLGSGTAVVANAQIAYVELEGPTSVSLNQQTYYECVFYTSGGVETFPPQTYEYYEWYYSSFTGTESPWICWVTWDHAGSSNFIEYGVTTWDNYYGDWLDITVN